MTAAHWGGLLFLAALCSGAAFLAMHYALRRLSATSVAVSTNLVPVVTLLAEGIYLSVVPTPQKLIGTFLAIAGVVLTEAGRDVAPTPRGSLG
jgi:drug/metabolite transporter (DMT)-like permease